MAMIETWVNQDLTAPVQVVYLPGNVFSQDNNGNLIGVNVFQGGEPATLSGSVSASVIRADGATVAVTGSMSGNQCSVILPQACYAVPGVVSIVIKLTSGETVTTVGAVVANVYRSSTDTAVDPGTIIPDISALIAAIDAAVASIPADYSSLWRAIDNGILGLGAATKLDASVFGFGDVPQKYELGAISSSDGTNTNSTTRIRTVGCYYITNGTTVSIDNSGAQYFIIHYNLDGTFKSYRTWAADEYKFTENEIARFVIRKSSSNPTISADEVDTLAAKLSVDISTVSFFDLDNIAAKVIPDNSDFNDLTVPGTYIVPSIASAQTMAHIPTASPGKVVVLSLHQANRFAQIYIANSTNSTIYIRTNTGTFGEWKKFVVDDTILLAKVTSPTSLAELQRSSMIYVSSMANATDAPPALFGLNRYAWVLYVEGSATNWMQYVYPTVDNPAYIRYTNNGGTTWTDWLALDNNDGTTPKYVAFGASTTVGAVHHFNGQAITYSKNNYPDYVGKVLGLKTVNLGQGTTGFLARNNADNNFLDQIYTHDSDLADAKLISIVFGYGNDGAAGTAQVGGLPIGSFDDYYPYDETGYHPSGYDDATIDSMVNKGCTLMGCLNWCIKWLQEKYPRAQLVIIFAAPSGNDVRTISIDANPQGESKGNAPKKITFANPYTPEASDKYNRRIYEIGQELPKLQNALNIPIIDLFFDKGIPFSNYATFATDVDGKYSVFSTKGDENDPTTWVWNSHPNDDGYLEYGRYIAGLIISQFKH